MHNYTSATSHKPRLAISSRYLAITPGLGVSWVEFLFCLYSALRGFSPGPPAFPSPPKPTFDLI